MPFYINKLLFFIFLFIPFFSSGKAASLRKPTAQRAAAQKALSKNFFEQAVQKLQRKQKSLNKRNFPFILEKNVCQVLEQAKAQNKAGFFSGALKESFFIEAVKTYGLVLEYSLDHNYFYCIYNYFKSPKPQLILDLTKKHLSEDKRKVFLDRLETCHKVELFGNGDTLSKFSKDKPSLKPLPLKDYLLLSKSKRLKFSNSLRKASLALEKEEPLLSAHPLLRFLIPIASAQSKEQCLIGGVFRDKVRQGDRIVCSAQNNSCDDRGNTFQCGVVFNSICIPLHPIKTVSSRCYKASQYQPLSRESYKDFLKSQNQAYHDYCFERQQSRGGYAGVGCNFYFKTIEELKDFYSAPSYSYLSEIPKLFLEGQNKEADFCEDCKKETNSQTVESIQTIAEILKSSEDSDLVKYLSNRIYENSQCKCGGNDACTRGCKKDKEKTERWTKLGCNGAKRTDKPTEYCMRHVLGALVDTIDIFLKQHCEAFNLQQCDEINRTGGEADLCKASFVMPSALCALNLDGKDRYSYIKSEEWEEAEKYKGVKKICNRHEEDNNKDLKTISILSDDGKTYEEVPLFEEIPLPENPDDLPTGSIVVMKSNSKHGHIEIKTDKKECDGKPCFCSDFCTSRSGGYRPPNQPLVAFRWHPKLIEYFGNQ